MVTVSESAKRVLKAILVATETDRVHGLRLMPDLTGNFVTLLDTELPRDLVIEHEGRKVLLIGIEYLRMLSNKTIDCQDTEEGAVLFVRDSYN